MYLVTVDYEDKNGHIRSDEFPSDEYVERNSIEMFNYIFNLIKRNCLHNFKELVDADCFEDEKE